MRKENLLTRTQAIALIGLDAVEAVEDMHVDYSTRVMQTDEIEFTSHHSLEDQDEKGNNGITIYYYQDKKTHQEMIDCENQLDDLDWSNPTGYEIY